MERYGVENLTSEFFPVEETNLWPTGTVKLPFMVFGYPSSQQLFDEERIGARSVEVKATYDGGSASPHLQRIKLENPYDADGMSGGPVFYIGGAPGGYFAGFAGLLMRGGSKTSYLHFMGAGFLIDLALETETEPWADSQGRFDGA